MRPPQRRRYNIKVVQVATTNRLLAVASAVALMAALPAAAAPSGQARLRLLQRQPIVLAGTSFLPRERVRVSLTVDGATRARAVVASARGSFTVTFASGPADRCAALVVRAAGTRGSRALLKVPQPACPPSLATP